MLLMGQIVPGVYGVLLILGDAMGMGLDMPPRK